MTVEGLMCILPRKTVYIYIANLMAKPVNLRKFMIVQQALKASSCNKDARDEEPCTMENKCQASTQCNSANSIHAVHRLTESMVKQVDRHSTVKESDGNANLNWRDE